MSCRFHIDRAQCFRCLVALQENEDFAEAKDGDRGEEQATYATSDDEGTDDNADASPRPSSQRASGADATDADSTGQQGKGKRRKTGARASQDVEGESTEQAAGAAKRAAGAPADDGDDFVMRERVGLMKGKSGGQRPGAKYGVFLHVKCASRVC